MKLDEIVIRSNETALYQELKKARELILYQTLYVHVVEFPFKDGIYNC
jgi:hypothetical protein